MEEIKATQTRPLLHANLISSLHPSAKNVFANGGDYLFDEAKKDLKSLEEKYDCEISHYGESVRLIFDGDIDDNEAVKVADKIDDVFADYDVKDMRFVSYTIYSGGDEIFAYYNVKTGNYQSEKD